MTIPLLSALAVVLAILLATAVPRLFLRRAQDRLATHLLDSEGGRFQLLTRAQRSAGKYRRVPGVLGLTAEALVFEGLFGEATLLPTSRIQKIITGRRLASGRRLLRLEVLRVTPAHGKEIEFVLAPDSAAAWRSHLGLWAVHERTAAMDMVTPGKK